MPRMLVGMVFALAATVYAADPPYTDVPFVPTPAKVVDAMLDLAGLTSADVLVDLGSGDGRIAIAAAKRFGIQATGVEIDPELVRQSQQTAWQEGVESKTSFVHSDLFAYDLRQATVIIMFLTPGVNLRLRPKLLQELRPGARVISRRFDMGSWRPAKTIQVEDDPVYLWVVPAGGIDGTESSASPVSSFQKLASMFSYDPTVPLDYRAEKSEPAAGVAAISYWGARGPVSATLVAPSGKGRHPAVIFAHDSGRRDEFLPEALALADARPPVVSLLIDAPPERPLGWRHSFNALTSDDNDREIHVQAVIDIRRGIDLLASRPDVDANRVAYVGHGYGGNWGVILASVEPRLRALVLVAAFPSLAELMASDDPEWANVRFALGGERFARYRTAMATVDPIHYARYANAPILFQFGRFDSFVSRAMAERLAQSAPAPRTVMFYDAGHSVNHPRAAIDRERFLTRTIRRRIKEGR